MQSGRKRMALRKIQKEREAILGEGCALRKQETIREGRKGCESLWINLRQKIG